MIHSVDLSALQLAGRAAVIRHTQTLRWPHKPTDFDLTYRKKHERAVEYVHTVLPDDNAPEFAYLKGEADLRGITLLAVANSIIAQATMLEAYDAQVERHRIAANMAIDAATQPSQINAAVAAFVAHSVATIETEIA